MDMNVQIKALRQLSNPCVDIVLDEYQESFERFSDELARSVALNESDASDEEKREQNDSFLIINGRSVALAILVRKLHRQFCN